MVILYNHHQYILCKDIFLRFSEQFANGRMNDIAFFQYHKELMRQQPELAHFVYQFALTACYKRENYNAHDLVVIFDKKFKIQDVYGMNGFNCDISTLNSAIVVDHMVRMTPFKSIPFTIFNAPLEYGTPFYKRVQATPTVSAYIENSKSQTGQTNNDILIGDRFYDIKHTEKTSSVYNHIYPWTFEKIQNQGQMYVNNLYVYLENSNIAYTQKLLPKIKNIKTDSSMTSFEKIKVINEYLSENWLSIEKHNVLLPIIIPMTSKPFVPRMHKNFHERLHIPADVMENQYAARRAACASIDVRYKTKAQQVFATAREMTDGQITSTLDNENLDLPD